MTCSKNGIKREGESCTLNNNCIYPKCFIQLEDYLILYPQIFVPGVDGESYDDYAITRDNVLEIMGKLEEDKDRAWKMVSQDLGNNISDIINQEGDEKTDGQIIDEIVDLLRKHNLYKERK